MSSDTLRTADPTPDLATPLTALQEALAAMPLHFAVGVRDGLGYDPDDNECAQCNEDWPCPTSRLLAALANLDAARLAHSKDEP